MGAVDSSDPASILARVRKAAIDVEAVTSIPQASTRPRLASSWDPVVLFDAVVTDAGLRKATRQMFCDGHYADAVRRGCVHVNNEVKNKSGIHKDGKELMNHAFGLPAPTLRLNAGRTQSETDEQEGYRYIFAGVMWGIRNPRSHDPVEDGCESALEMLTMANHLLRLLGRAKRTRRRRSQVNAS
jgi:uncharacterized protein (TIGR02391 family)